MNTSTAGGQQAKEQNNNRLPRYIRAVCYLREHSDQPMTEERRLGAQRARCQEAAKAYGARMVGEFIDVGPADEKDRPGLHALLRRAEEKPFVQLVIVDQLSLLASSAKEFEWISREMSENRVALVAANPAGATTATYEQSLKAMVERRMAFA